MSATGSTAMTEVERLRGETEAAPLRELLSASLARLASRENEAARTDTTEEWKDFYEPVFLGREIWLRTGLPEDKERMDAICADYNARFTCTSCTPAGLCRGCTFRGGSQQRDDVARSDANDSPDYRSGAEYARQRYQGDTPMPRSPEYNLAKRASLAYLLPDGRPPTSEEQARFDAASVEYDKQHDFRASQTKQHRTLQAVRTDAKGPFDGSSKARDEDGREVESPVTRAKRRADNRMHNAWREPLDKEGARQVELARLGNTDPSDDDVA